MHGHEEVILPFPRDDARLGLATDVRSTLIASSRESLKRRGLFDRYVALLDPQHRDALLTSVAGEWLPIALGQAHYAACDRLDLPVDEVLAMGTEVSQKLHDTFLGVVIRMSKGAGVTPWVLLPKGNQLYGRLFRGGGGTRITKLGPKEARAEVAGVPMLALPYFRHGLRAIYQAGVSLFCTRVYVHEIPRMTTPTATAMKLAWA